MRCTWIVNAQYKSIQWNLYIKYIQKMLMWSIFDNSITSWVASIHICLHFYIVIGREELNHVGLLLIVVCTGITYLYWSGYLRHFIKLVQIVGFMAILLKILNCAHVWAHYNSIRSCGNAHVLWSIVLFTLRYSLSKACIKTCESRVHSETKASWCYHLWRESPIALIGVPCTWMKNAFYF